ncbi:hypothetical protein GOV08_00060 [Candidatus Woesearchaeota archaeon]|nr:hypothetical protein [Candidatus Woesearchaeota archaeon]
MGFVEMIRTLESYGISDVLLPFILIFTIVFAVLQKTKVLGDGRKNFNVVIALVMSLAVIIPHVLNKYPPGSDVVDIMNKALPNVSLVLVAILMVLIMAGVFGHNINLAGASLGGWITIIGIFGVVAIFGSAAGWNMFGWIRINEDVRNLVVIILVFGVIIGFITRETPGDKAEGMFNKLGDSVKSLLGKP